MTQYLEARQDGRQDSRVNSHLKCLKLGLANQLAGELYHGADAGSNLEIKTVAA